jgi:hypothetical protein
MMLPDAQAVTVEDVREALTAGLAIRRYTKSGDVCVRPDCVRAHPVDDWWVGIDARTAAGRPDGSYGEWRLTWHEFDGSGGSLRLDIYSDGMAAFLATDGLMSALLAAGDDPAVVEAALVGLGFVDTTERVMPQEEED